MSGLKLFVTIEYIDEQRAAGWPEMHPEDFCHRCGGRNLSWWTDSATWNMVMRPAGEFGPWNEIICPQCFAELHGERFPNTSWSFTADPITRGGKASLMQSAAAPTRKATLAAERLLARTDTAAPLERESAAQRQGEPQ